MNDSNSKMGIGIVVNKLRIFITSSVFISIIIMYLIIKKIFCVGNINYSIQDYLDTELIYHKQK